MISVTIFAIAAAMSAGQPVPTAKPAVAVDDAASLKDAPLQSGEGRAVATKLADELTQNFVYPEQGGRYAAMLRANAAAGKYDAGSRGDLATRMTADLMAVQKDGHLGVSVAEPPRRRDGGEGEWRGPPLIQSAKWLAPGVAYIRFTAFISTDEEVAPPVRSWRSIATRRR
ncbi:hypothetical protein SH584_06020 [Sphingomonas sp. LY29]|uniref:hypothetical protein n=1 Tax=Sphingomonas sp. LY29 TaxID=3095341 RepID=UPI002D7851DA|nr:hypothetical protein [Sphingomonas sp. LY29]WRP26976.1 hypothetical protein SH584_06020 [Sphingomonas sp. LY29]